MTSWKCKARLFLLVLLSTIDLSYGNCMEYFNVDKWTGNITQVITLVEPEDHQDTVECSLERAARENKTSARSYESILYDCFRIVSKQGKPVNLYTEKCKGNTSGTMPFYQFMCLTLAAIKHKYPDVEIEAEQCEYDTTCKFLSGGPSTATPRTLPERTVVTPMKTTTELPPTTNLTQSNAEKTFSNEKENLALKIFSVISASLNVAALMVFLYQRGSNPRLSHESVATYVTDRASLEAQLVTELKPTELDPISSYSPLTPNGFHVGNEE
ncbi:uncharacterized protein LOC119013698 isoform X9 [Acanthopagrus latus]|uniref:uncharacterized protein LOC119013698 isoform X9 n=1 Tax=Acanthopagrus latus TaxID=8177 RepID=UPI00187C221B|nr:uncharacterized protein LOC119013698 isoform X9 [Acanthopagrus latus]